MRIVVLVIGIAVAVNCAYAQTPLNAGQGSDADDLQLQGSASNRDQTHYPMRRSQAAELLDSLDCGRRATIYTKAGKEFSGRLCCGVDNGIGLWTKQGGLSVFTYDELQSVQLCSNRAGRGAIEGFMGGMILSVILGSPSEPDFSFEDYLPHIAIVTGCTVVGALIGSTKQTCKTISDFSGRDICLFERSESTAPGATLNLEFRIVLAKF